MTNIGSWGETPFVCSSNESRDQGLIMATVSSGQRIPFSCPHCGHPTEVDMQFAGQSGPCVSCNNIVTIPTFESLYATSPEIKTPSREKPVWVKLGIGIGATLCLAVLGVVVWALVQPTIQAAREAAKCSECESNLMLIGQALDSYYAEHGEYPPAVKRDENGKALYSWRVLILPHLGLEERQLAAQFNMDEPWNSKHNLKLTTMIPDVYVCPSDIANIKGNTSYLAIVGDQTVINDDKPVRRSGDYDGPRLTDLKSETMVIMDASDCGVNWMEPKDIKVASLRAGLNGPNQIGGRSEHSQGVNVLMADGSIVRLQDTVTTEDLRGMASINGDEFIQALDEQEY